MGKEIYDFKGRDKLGQIGEVVCQEFLRTCHEIKDIENVRGVKEYQKKDIDLVLTLKDESIVYIEVKTDSYKSGNLFYEWIANDQTNEVGCMERTEANYIFYYFIHPEYRKVYVFEINQFRDWVYKHREEYVLKRIYNYGYCSFGYCFPLEVLEKEVQGLRIIDLNGFENIEWFEEQARNYWDK